ncbi:MAG: glycosyltransferase [Anaerolineae bacterium]|jgi:glycosyltransferase involved in cell wall biosynthesis
MDVSVIVPFRDTETYIEDCVRALLAQAHPTDDVEIILVDNDSRDRSAEIVRRYSQIKLLSEHEPGAYAARNRGIAEARGDILAFTDPDCVPCANWLEQLTAAVRRPGVGIVMGRQQFASDSPILAMLEAYETEKATHVFSGNVKEVYFGHTNNLAVRRKLFDRCGPFRQIARGADTIFVRLAVDEYGCSIARYCPEACVRHLELASVWDYYRKQLIYGRSNRDNAQIAAYRPLTNRERLRVLRHTARRRSYSVREVALLSCLLGVGAICYGIGRRRPIRRGSSLMSNTIREAGSG